MSDPVDAVQAAAVEDKETAEQVAAAQTQVEAESNTKADEWRDLLDERTKVLREILQFRTFLTSAIEPRVSDVEIIACFADLRGFTAYCRRLQVEMQDRKIQNFLKAFPRIFVEGLARCLVSSTDPSSEFYDPGSAAVAHAAIPRLYKNMGDGMMLVWEIPADFDNKAQSDLTDLILQAPDHFQWRFNYYFRNLTPIERDSYSDAVLDLDLGLGLARGHAWKLDYDSHIDYAGSVVNLASRLQDLARPSGVVAHRDISPYTFDRRATTDRGRLGTYKGLTGDDTTIELWVSNTVQLEGLEPLAAREGAS